MAILAAAIPIPASQSLLQWRSPSHPHLQKFTTTLCSSSSSSSSVATQEESGSSSTPLPAEPQPSQTTNTGIDPLFRGCKTCGKVEIEKGCNGEGRIQGGIAIVPGFGWWPIKAYRPCPGFVASGGRYRRRGQSMDEVASGRGRSPRRDVSAEKTNEAKSRDHSLNQIALVQQKRSIKCTQRMKIQPEVVLQDTELGTVRLKHG